MKFRLDPNIVCGKYWIQKSFVGKTLTIWTIRNRILIYGANNKYPCIFAMNKFMNYHDVIHHPVWRLCDVTLSFDFVKSYQLHHCDICAYGKKYYELSRGMAMICHRIILPAESIWGDSC